MTKYQIRIEKEKGKVVVWIDKDGEICIKQPMRPGRSEKEGWASEEEAIEWAEAHRQSLLTSAANNEIVEINKQANEELQRHANRATILQAAALAVFAAKENEEFAELFIDEAKNNLQVLHEIGGKYQGAIENVKSNYKEINSWQQILALE
jgi:hypothetical protein